MRTLVIDTATAACSVTLWSEGEGHGDPVLGNLTEIVNRSHAERLVPMIAELPGGGRADHILVDVGPGSFTGIRVGIAAARALGLGWGATTSGYSSLALIATGIATETGDTDPFAVVIEGGHGEVFMQSFAAPSGLITPLDDMVSCKPEVAMARLGDRYALGSGVRWLPDLPQRQNGGPDWLPDTYHAMMLPEPLRQLPPAPIYGRAPDARLPA